MSTVDVAANTNPFPGLRPFQEEEKHLFFGRERQINAMINKLADARFLAVVGASGSGKSSLVNCGLRPALHRGLLTSAGTAWRMAQFRPGSDPMAAMANALAEDGVLYARQDNGLPLEEIIDTHLRVSKRGLLEVFRKAPLADDINLLVVVDQFEELFRYRTLATAQKADESRQEAIAFIKLLLEVRQQTDYPIYVAITMRSDFLGDCAQFAGLTEAINAGQFLVPRMTRDERRAAIAGPVGVGRIEILHIGQDNGQADVAGPVGVGWAQITPALLTRLVNDVGDKPDQLSILQHALNRTWARWEHEGGREGPLNLEHYKAIGTMARALDQHAEKAYGELKTERQQKLCERLFKTLTDKGTDARGIRRPTTLGTLCALTGANEAKVIEVIDVFRKPSRSFLMPPKREMLDAETVIDISHESLMRVWERLKTWADEEADSARIYRRLVETATLYKTGQASLWRDPDLQLALDWREHEQPTEAWAALYGGGFEAAMAFLDESEALRAHELLVEKKRQRRLRILLVILAFFALIATGAFLVALESSNEATKQSERAEASFEEADSLRVIAEASLIETEKQRIFADSSAARADRQRILADSSAAEADRHRILADSSASEAEILRRFADSTTQNLRLNNSRRLALQASTFLENKPDVALLLSVEAIRNAFTEQAYKSQSNALQQNPQLNTFFHGHTRAVRSVAFSPDGKRLASGSDDNTIILWDLETRKSLDTLRHPFFVWSLAFSPDSQYIAAGSRDYTVRLWDAATGKALSMFNEHTSTVNSVAFSPDSRHLASAGDNTIILWDIARRRLNRSARLEGHTNKVNSVAFSPNGKTLASASDDGTIRLWDAATGDLVMTLTGHDGDVTSVAFSSDGTRLASGSKDDTIILWDAASGAPLKTLQGHTSDVRSVAFSPNGKTLASGSADNTIILWHAASGDSLTTFKGHAGAVLSVAFSPDGANLASSSADGKVILWNVPIGQEAAAEAETSAALTTLEGHTGLVRSVAFSPDGKTLASSSENGTIILWGIEKRQALGEPLQGHDYAFSVAFSPDVKTLATASIDGTVVLWDIENRDADRDADHIDLPRHQDFVLSMAFSPDGKTLASASNDGTVILWDVERQEARGEPLQGHQGAVWSVAFSPDSTHLASGSEDGTVILWDIATHQTLDTLRGHQGTVRSVAFSPDGKTLASASCAGVDRGSQCLSGDIRLWNVETRQVLQTLREHTDEVLSVAFSPDSTRLASGSADGTIILWDIQSGDRLQILGGDSGPVQSVAFSLDGKTLASSQDDTVILWDVDLQARACRIANRNLTQAEWEQYIGTENPYRCTCTDLPPGEETALAKEGLTCSDKAASPSSSS